MPELTDELHQGKNSDLIKGSKLLGEADYAAVNSVRSNFAKIVDMSNNEGKKILITDHKKPAAAVVPVSEFRILMLLEKVGMTQQLTELTYEDISVDEALEALNRMSTEALNKGANEPPEDESREHGHGSRAERRPPKPKVA
jgi:prevent-host-death family protein